MNIPFCGVNFSHEKGVFCKRKQLGNYFISCFSTPYLYEHNHTLYSGNADELLFMTPGTDLYHGPQSDEESFINDWIFISGEDFEALIKKYPLPENISFRIEDPCLLKTCIQKIQTELIQKNPGYEEIIACCLTETIIRLHRQVLDQHDPNTASISQVEMVRNHIFQYPEQDWSLKSMAELSGYSVSRFCALYTQRFGVSPKTDLLSRRIDLAKQLLLYSRCPVTEVAERCGFKTIYYFSRYFKATVGISPQEYAKNGTFF